jgi:ubiquinone/menaquinone biosynthesis C-methylase UbiE
MSFDRLAPHYRWMEWLLAGGKLQRCRTTFLDLLPPVRHALLLGEGNGQFLREFLRKQPAARVTCVDASPRMLKEAEGRARCPSAPQIAPITFICCDVAEWEATPGEFDLVVSNFFLDCFRPEQIELIAEKISAALTEDARWMIADFSEADRGWRKWRARMILRAMYWFFRHATNLPANRLTAPDAMLARNGFQLQARRTFEWGLLQSDLWVRRHVEAHVRNKAVPHRREPFFALNSR